MIRAVFCLVFAAAAVSGAAAQDRSAPEDTRTQYPAWLANSYFTVSVGYIGYDFSAEQLEPGFQATSVTVPHVAARLAIFGHEFNRHLSVEATYMRPVHYVVYRGVDGDASAHHVWMHFGGATVKSSLDLTRRVALFGEAGLGITSRHGFEVNDTDAVRHAHYASVIAGGGLEYRAAHSVDLIAGALFSPGHSADRQRATVLVSGGFRYTMRPLPPERVAANRDAGYIFPRQLVQLEYSTGYGYGVNTFVSRKIPVFWGGSVQVDRGAAVHYQRNVFHTRKVFGLDFGGSASVWRSRAAEDKFFTLSAYPLLRFTFLRTRALDLYAMYSLAGPTYISQTTIDGRDTGNRFTFQDFMGLGVYVGKDRRTSLGVKINHYSNGNIFTSNAGLKIPLTFTFGRTF
jgi:lipid A 3-O-deacylase PagL